MADAARPLRVIILGGGFGGVYTSLHLERLTRKHSREFEITLISRANHFLMTPLLFEAGSGVLEPRHAVNPIRPLLQRTRFIESEVLGVDFDRKVVITQKTQEDPKLEHPFDHLVIGLGGVTNTSIIPGSDEAMTFKTLPDAIFLRNHVIDLFERAEIEQDPVRRKKLFTIVVIGAGLVGVELMGEQTEFFRAVRRHYPRLANEPVHFHLFEAGPNVLPEMERPLADHAVRALEKRGVEVLTSSPVERIESDRVHLKSGRVVEADTILLATGVAPNPLLATFPLERGKGGRIVCDATLRVKDREDVWAVGDAALIPDPDGKPYPPLAQHALRQAKTLARNIVAAARNQPLSQFTYRSLGTLAALGHYDGVGRVMFLRLRGFFAWWVWRSYYLFQMPRFDRRLRVILDWTVALFFRSDVARLDLYGQQHPLKRNRTTGETQND